MHGILFEWSPAKAMANEQKHGVSFYDAMTLFGDLLSKTVADPGHSAEEDRYVTIGRAQSQRLLVVVHTERGERIRLISARKATKRERQQYEAHTEETT